MFDTIKANWLIFWRLISLTNRDRSLSLYSRSVRKSRDITLWSYRGFKNFIVTIRQFSICSYIIFFRNCGLLEVVLKLKQSSSSYNNLQFILLTVKKSAFKSLACRSFLWSSTCNIWYLFDVWTTRWSFFCVVIILFSLVCTVPSLVPKIFNNYSKTPTVFQSAFRAWMNFWIIRDFFIELNL